MHHTNIKLLVFHSICLAYSFHHNPYTLCVDDAFQLLLLKRLKDWKIESVKVWNRKSFKVNFYLILLGRSSSIPTSLLLLVDLILISLDLNSRFSSQIYSDTWYKSSVCCLFETLNQFLIVLEKKVLKSKRKYLLFNWELVTRDDRRRWL